MRFPALVLGLSALASPLAGQVQPRNTAIDTVWDRATAADSCVVYATVAHTDAPRPWTGDLPQSLEGVFVVSHDLPDSAQDLRGAYRLRIQKHWLGAIGALKGAFRDLGPLDQRDVYATTCELFREKLENPREPYFVMERIYSTTDLR